MILKALSKNSTLFRKSSTDIYSIEAGQPALNSEDFRKKERKLSLNIKTQKAGNF